MKTLRRILIALAAPAALLLGLTQLGGTPIYKGYNTGLTSTVESSPAPGLRLSTDTRDLTCWVKLKLPAASEALSASLSNGVALSVFQESIEGADQWVEVVAEGQKREEKFKWPSGATLFVSIKSGGSSTLSNWRVYLSDQAFDSKDRATWRTIAFTFSLLFLGLALLGGALEAYSKLKDETDLFTHESCLEQLIKSIEGDTRQETKWMRTILTKILLQGVTGKDAVAPLPLKNYQKHILFIKAADLFCRRLEWIIVELTNDLKKVQ